MIREQEGKVKGKAWVKDDKVVVYIDGGHILRDLALVHEYNHKARCTWIWLETLRLRVAAHSQRR